MIFFTNKLKGVEKGKKTMTTEMKVLLLGGREYKSKAGVELIELFFLNLDLMCQAIRTMEKADFELMFVEAPVYSAENPNVYNLLLEDNGFSKVIAGVELAGKFVFEIKNK